MIRRSLSASRYLIAIAVACTFIGATTLLIYGAADTFQLIAALLGGGTTDNKTGKQLILDFIEVTDMFLLATVLYIVAVGLYALFIDDTIALPAWLEIHNLDDLKNKLIAVVIVVLGVVFLGQAITWDGQRELLGFGVAIALVITALTFFLSQKVRKDQGEGIKGEDRD